MKVKPHHPLQEAIARMLFGIEGVPPEAARRMVSQTAAMAAEYVQKTEAKHDRLREALEEIRELSTEQPDSHTPDMVIYVVDCALQENKDE